MYDAIVVGARTAGSPTAMLLARRGYRVLVVDRAGFPSDTLSTHYIHQAGVAHLNRWGLLEQLTATNVPAARRLTFDLGPFALTGTPPPADGAEVAYAPRRRVLDKILLDAAAAAGAEVRERFSVESSSATATASSAFGAGRPAAPRSRRRRASSSEPTACARSSRGRCRPRVRRAAGPHVRLLHVLERRPARRRRALPARRRVIGTGPTNDGLAIVIAFWPKAEFRGPRRHRGANFRDVAELAPSLAARLRRRACRALLRLRRPAVLLPQAVRAGLGARGRRGLSQGSAHGRGNHRRFPRRRAGRGRDRRRVRGGRPLEEALAGYERQRNEDALPVYDFTYSSRRSRRRLRRDAAALRRPPREPGGDEPLLRPDGENGAGRRLLRAREHRANRRRRGGVIGRPRGGCSVEPCPAPSSWRTESRTQRKPGPRRGTTSPRGGHVLTPPWANCFR